MSGQDWRPYVPPWYPDLGEHHNPFAMNGQEGAGSNTRYADWCNRLPAGELEQLIAESRAGTR